MILLNNLILESLPRQRKWVNIERPLQKKWKEFIDSMIEYIKPPWTYVWLTLTLI